MQEIYYRTEVKENKIIKYEKQVGKVVQIILPLGVFGYT
jgi:hypothetical protein